MSKCEPWCSNVKQPWRAKCDWRGCGGCNWCNETISNLENVLPDFCNPKQSHTKFAGASFVDLDNDGYLDLCLSTHYRNVRFLHNVAADAQQTRNRYIVFLLKGTTSNEYGIGSTLFLSARGVFGTDEETTQFQEINTFASGLDKYGNRDFRRFFGLGLTGVPLKLTVRWPNRVEQEVALDESMIDNMGSVHVVTQVN